MRLRIVILGLCALVAPLSIYGQTPVHVDGYSEWSRGDHLIVDGEHIRWNQRTRLRLPKGVATPASLPLGWEVNVRGVRQPDGTVFAMSLEAKPNNTAMFEAESQAGGAALEAFMVEKGAMLQPTSDGGLTFVGRLQQTGPLVDRLHAILVRVAPPYVNATTLRLYVVETPGWNAMVLPNGAVVVYSGLAASMNDDEMAVILGHELAHYTHEHSRRKMKRAMWLQMANAAADAALSKLSSEGAQYGLAVSAVLTLSAIQNGYGRDLEDQADRVGLRYAFEAGFDVTCGPRLWQRFGEKYGDTDRITNFFMGDHSLSAARVRNLEAQLRYNYAGRRPRQPRAIAPAQHDAPVSTGDATHEEAATVVTTAESGESEPIDGYSMDRVRALYGPPSTIQTDPDGVTTWYYDTASGTRRVYFLNRRASRQRQR